MARKKEVFVKLKCNKCDNTIEVIPALAKGCSCHGKMVEVTEDNKK